MPKVYKYSGFANKIVEVQTYEFWSTNWGEIENTNQVMLSIALKISDLTYIRTTNKNQDDEREFVKKEKK